MAQIPTRFNFPAPRRVDLTPQGQYPVAEYTGPAATFDEVLARQATARQQAARSYQPFVAPMPQAAAMTPQEQMAASVRAKGMMPTAPAATPAGAPPMGLADAFRQPLTSPMGRGITAAALTGLDAGGWTDRPTTIGQGLARMGAAGIQAFDAAKAAEAAQAAEQQKLALDAAQAEFDRRYKAADLQIKAREKPIKPVMRMLPVEGGTQLTMLDPYTGEVLGTAGDIKPASGMTVSVDADGNVTLTQGAAGIEKSTKKDLEKDILELTNQISMLDQASLSYDPSLLTYGAELESLFGTTLSKINPDALSPEQKNKIARRTQFVRGIQQTFSTLLNQLSGAAVSAFELRNAKKYSVNPDDSPVQFESKLRDQSGFAKAALYRAQQVLGGETITSDLSKKYPIAIRGKDSNGKMQKLYMHEFVEKYMRGNDVDQATAIEAYAEMAKGSGQ